MQPEVTRPVQAATQAHEDQTLNTSLTASPGVSRATPELPRLRPVSRKSPTDLLHKRFGAIKSALCWAAEALLSLRYSISLRGFRSIPKNASGFLVVPNHPGLIDPVIVTACLWNRFRLRPVVTERFYHMRGLHLLMKAIGAIPMPDLEVDGGFYKRRRVQEAIASVAEALRRGDNVLMYPSGRLMRSGLEQLGGKSGLYTILQEHPDLKLLLVRTRGIYGSVFSTAQNGGKTPELGQAFKKCLPRLLKNFFLFSPRRRVEVDMTPAPKEIAKAGSAALLNRSLEQWYNQGATAEPVLVPYSRWNKKLPEIPPPQAEDAEVSDIPEEVRTGVLKHVARISGAAPEGITPAMHLEKDLNMDSLQIADLLLSLQDELGAGDIELPDMTTVAAVMKLTAKRAPKEDRAKAAPAPSAWRHDEGLRETPKVAEGSTIQECFLNCAAGMSPESAALADERSGVLTWRKLKLAVLSLSSLFSRYGGSRIGIMLPASAAASVSFMAALTAKKTPVMLNWTAGAKNLAHAIKASEAEVIVTSRAFLDRVQTDLGAIEHKFVFLEDLRANMKLGTKLRALVKSHLPSKTLLKILGLSKIEENDTAAILFTSGSEAAPKGVPLTHRNILSNIRGAMELASFRPNDVLYGFLPPFHSFGLSLCTIAPMVGGLKTVLHPDPNESRKLAAGCAKWGVSLMAGTPAFLKGILSAGSKEHFPSLRLLISGADRMPPELPALAQSLTGSAELLEGYGITECAPMVTANRPNETPLGVGKALPGVELLVVDHETLTPLPDGERGLVLISGPNVFPGYLGGTPDPFVTLSGKRWYNSGDLGYLQEGRLVLSGRLKRFVKVGGEMISLPALEDVLAKAWPSSGSTPEVAVLAEENPAQERPQFVLCTVRPEITLELANNCLRSGGVSPLARFARVAYLEEMPLLGSGKVDIQKLKASFLDRS